MSINKFQEKIFRTGCGTSILYVSAGVFAAGMFYMGCGAGSNQQGNSQQKQQPLVSVGDQPINAGTFEQSMQAQLDSMRRQNPDATGPDAIPPDQEAQLVARNLSDGLQGLGYLYLAKQSGVKFTDERLKQEMEKGIEERIMAIKMQLAPELKLSQGATDKEFDAALAKQKRPTLSAAKQDAEKEISADLKDPQKRQGLEMSTSQTLYTESLQAKLAPTDEQLKASYDNYTFKKILFGADTGATADAQVAKAQADLKSGQTFEQVMDRYSKASPPKGKKVSDSTESMDAAQLDRSPADAPLKSLKVGEVSGVIDDLGGKAIFKLISVSNTAPPDLLKNKAKYADDFAKPKAQSEAAANLKALLNSKVVVWNSPGYKALFDWYSALMDFSNQAPIGSRIQPIIDEAKKAVQTNQGYDARAALLAWYAAENVQWSNPGADKAKLRPGRIELLKAMTQDTSYESLKLELVDLLTEDKNPEAGQALLDAAQSNTEYDSFGQKSFQDVNAKLQKLKDAKLVNADLETKIQKAQDDWVKENDSEEQQKAAAKTAQAEQAKADAALQAQQMAEQAKAKANASKNAPAPAKSGTLPPATTAGSTPAPATTGSAPAPTAPAGKK